MILQAFDLSGKTALVTGATHGIGVALTQALGEAGAMVVFCGRNAKNVAKAAAYYESCGINARGYVCDVSDEGQVSEMMEKIHRDVGCVNILVNNAGITIRKPMTDLSLEDFQKVINVNLTGPFLMSKAVIPEMIANGGGKIINICSLMSELGRMTNAAYTASKGGLKMLTRNISSEYGQYNIQCNGIGPGYIETPLTEPLREPLEDGSVNPFDVFVKSKTPAGRWGRVEDLMGPVVFLASAASDYINGQIIYCDGGLLSTIGKQISREDL